MAGSKIVIDPVQLGKLAELCCSHDEVAAYFRCSTTTVKHRLKRDPLKSVWEVGIARGRISLRRAQLQAAHAGDRTMLIWLGKQLLGQVEKIETKNDNSQKFVVEVPTPMTSKEWLAAYGKAGEEALEIGDSSRPIPKSKRSKKARVIDIDSFTELPDIPPGAGDPPDKQG